MASFNQFFITSFIMQKEKHNIQPTKEHHKINCKITKAPSLCFVMVNKKQIKLGCHHISLNENVFTSPSVVFH